MSEQNRKYRIDTDENRAFLRELTEDLLNFGHQFPSPGGASYYLGDDGTPWKGRNRETWITCRMAHVYSIGSFLGHAGSEELVDAALKGLHGELKDTVNGGWYPGRTPEDQILPDKQCYAHAFVILAATSGLLAGRPGAKDLLDDALALYDLRFWNEEEGLACDTWNTEFTVLDDYRGLNANMHTVEAFLAVADVLSDEKYRVRAGRIIDRVLGWAKENAHASGLGDAPIRWLVDDCVKFVEREIRRSNKYDGIIMDPPSYGRGPKGEIWKIEESIWPFIELTTQILSEDALFFLINSYTTGLQPAVLSYMINTAVVNRLGGHVEAAEIGLPVEKSGLILPCGASGRWTR